MDKLISLRAYARRRGCELGAVQKAISSGRIAKAATRDPATGRLAGVDPDLADELWARNTDPIAAAKSGKVILSPARGLQEPGRLKPAGIEVRGSVDAERDLGSGAGAAMSRAGNPMSASAMTATPAGDSLDAPPPIAEALAPGGQGGEYYGHRAKREKFLAEQAEIDYLRKVGLLVAVDEVERSQFQIWRQVRDAVVKAFDRADATLAGVPTAAPARGRLRADLRTSLNELSQSLALDTPEGPQECADSLL
jgi:hypothetical protein